MSSTEDEHTIRALHERGRSGLCGCGCGQSPSPGKRFIRGHVGRTWRRTTPRAQRTGRCPACHQVVGLRDDDRPGRHFTGKRRKAERYRCPAGEIGNPPPPTGRRVSIRFDVVIPNEWTNGEYRQMLRDLLLRHAAEGFVVDMTVVDTEGGAA